MPLETIPAPTSPRTDSPHPLAELDPDDVVAEYARRGLHTLDDAGLISAVAEVVSVPRASAPDSFVLHAPLEVLARAGLLQHCSPGVRARARHRLVWSAARYARADRAAEPARREPPADVDIAVGRLAAAVGRGELDDAFVAGAWLGRTSDPVRLAALVGDLVVPSLAAAAHGPIFLQLLPRVAARVPEAGALFGVLARELARNPDTRMRWSEDRPPVGVEPDTSTVLGDAVANTPVLGVSGRGSIRELMEQVETSGLATELIAPALGGDPATAHRTLLRISTESMLLDDPDRAPYGWTHCLTLPLAVTAIAPQLQDQATALAVAATHVVGFRTALASAPLTELRQQPGAEPAERFSLADPPAVAAATLRGAAPAELRALVRSVVDVAAVHPDAHLAKYVVACLETARSDPDHARQHLAAAAHLAAWWTAQPAPADDPLLDADV